MSTTSLRTIRTTNGSNQKDTVEISGTHIEERRLVKFDTLRT